MPSGKCLRANPRTRIRYRNEPENNENASGPINHMGVSRKKV
jgi:hypothetical protein